ncbi:MAG: hypothetical protein OEW11_04225 [Nitrospirota bacterium]|nr:hypothetical protein [Nitrospirota bacterium]
MHDTDARDASVPGDMHHDPVATLTRAAEPLMRMIEASQAPEAERLEARRRLLEMQSILFARLLESERLRAALPPATSGWMRHSWRPVSMLTFLILVVCDTFGWLPTRLSDSAWTLLQISMGGYVVGRSVEKVAPELLRPRTA